MRYIIFLHFLYSRQSLCRKMAASKRRSSRRKPPNRANKSENRSCLHRMCCVTIQEGDVIRRLKIPDRWIPASTQRTWAPRVESSDRMTVRPGPHAAPDGVASPPTQIVELSQPLGLDKAVEPLFILFRKVNNRFGSKKEYRTTAVKTCPVVEVLSLTVDGCMRDVASCVLQRQTRPCPVFDFASNPLPGPSVQVAVLSPAHNLLSGALATPSNPLSGVLATPSNPLSGILATPSNPLPGILATAHKPLPGVVAFACNLPGVPETIDIPQLGVVPAVTQATSPPTSPQTVDPSKQHNSPNVLPLTTFSGIPVSPVVYSTPAPDSPFNPASCSGVYAVSGPSSSAGLQSEGPGSLPGVQPGPPGAAPSKQTTTSKGSDLADDQDRDGSNPVESCLTESQATNLRQTNDTHRQDAPLGTAINPVILDLNLNTPPHRLTTDPAPSTPHRLYKQRPDRQQHSIPEFFPDRLRLILPRHYMVPAPLQATKDNLSYPMDKIDIRAPVSSPKLQLNPFLRDFAERRKRVLKDPLRLTDSNSTLFSPA